MGNRCECGAVTVREATNGAFERIVGQSYVCFGAAVELVMSEGRAGLGCRTRTTHGAGISALGTGSGRNNKRRNRRWESDRRQRDDRRKDKGYFLEVYNKYTHRFKSSYPHHWFG